MKMNQKLTSLLVMGALLAFGSTAAMAAPDWSKVPKKDIHVFHPGAAPIEWTGKGDHSGASGLKKGEACAGCHVEDGKLSLDLKRLASKEMEPKGAPKTMTYPVGVQAAYDATNLYVRLTFKAPTGGFDKSDKENEVKATHHVPERQGADGRPGRLLGGLPQGCPHDAGCRRQEDQVRDAGRHGSDAVEER
jgi:hypothetical protein